ncbi:MAG: LysE family translocator [Rhodospirillales bacterium]
MAAMNVEILTALIGFAFVSSITPGPNNLMLMASGANFGFVRTIPHMVGVGAGHFIQITLLGAGLIRVFEAYPAVYTGLKWFCVAYLIWLAWKIANAASPALSGGADGASAREKSRPMNFLQAALFQWVNPKAWAMALTAITVYTPDRSMTGVMTVAAVFLMTNMPAVSVWTALGQQLRRLLTTAGRLRAFNLTMAVLLAATLYPVLLL